MLGALAGALLFPATSLYATSNEALGPDVANVSYAAASDADLTAIAARWDDLNAQQRRALLSEVKMRMKRSGDARGTLRIKIHRRYGTVVRHSNGSRTTLRVEVRTIKKRGNQGFGVGFEQRAGQDGAASDKAGPNPPVVKVTDPDE